MSSIIEEVIARKLFNSRGQETIEVDIITTDGFGSAAAPAGASKGKAEVVSYPIGGVTAAIQKLEELVVPELIGMDAEEQGEIDTLLHEIDGTDNFSNIGGNVAFAISVANAEAAATSNDLVLFRHLSGHLVNELPYPLGNVLGGGKHTFGKTTDIQEYLVIPFKASCFAEAAKANIMVHNKIGVLLRRIDPNFTGGRGDEGAWAPNLENEEALKIVAKACEEVSSELGIDPEQVWSYGKHPLTVKARSLLCYWAVRKLGYSATELSKRLGVSQPSVSISVKRGEKIAKAERLQLEKK